MVFGEKSSDMVTSIRNSCAGSNWKNDKFQARQSQD
jgi:hypothetical protein